MPALTARMSSPRRRGAGNRTSMMVTDSGGTKMRVYDDTGNMVHDATYAYGYDPENRLVKVKKSGDLPALTLGQALDSPCVYTTGGNANWAPTRTELYYGNRE